jgi:hypothetical protein
LTSNSGLIITPPKKVGGSTLAAQASKELATMLDTAGQSGQALMLCLRCEYPSEWAAFAASTTANFTATLRKDARKDRERR